MKTSKFSSKNLYFIILLLLCCFNCKASVPDTLSSSSIEYEYAFEEAIKQYDFGNYSQALYLLKKCIDVNNNSSACYYQISNIYLLAGDSKSALNYVRKAYELDNSNIWISLLLIKCYQLIDMNDSAILMLKSTLKLQSDNMELKYEYGNMLANSGRFDEAFVCFNEIDSKIGCNEGTALARHQIYVQKHDYNNAVTELELLIKAFPNELKFYGMLAELYSSIHNIAKAKEIYKELFQIDSSNNLALISITDFYRDIKDYKTAISLLDKLIEKPEIELGSKLGLLLGYIRNDSDLFNNKAMVRENIGKLLNKYQGDIKVERLLVDFYIRINNYDSAIIVLDGFIKREDSKEIWDQYFLLLNSRAKYESIIKSFPEARLHAGDIAEIYILTAIAYIQLKDYDEAIDLLNEALSVKILKEGDKLEILKYKAEAFYKLKKMALSDSCFEEVLKLDPKDYLTLNNYSFYLALRDTNLLKAITMSRKVVKRFPENSIYIDTYAYILMKMHKYNLAYRYMKRAIAYNSSKDPEIYEHMGDILLLKGRKEDAIIYWNKAINLGRIDLKIDDKLKSIGK
jgi:tetratricopeptide (TPR) repeat protein